MALIITEDCINCGACEAVCPNTAIYEGNDDWRWKDGTKLHGNCTLPSGMLIDADAGIDALIDDYYYIVPGKCTECKGHFETSQCQLVCPVDCCLPDPEHRESEEVLMNRKLFLHKG